MLSTATLYKLSSYSTAGVRSHQVNPRAPEASIAFNLFYQLFLTQNILKQMSEQIQNFTSMNPFDDNIIDDSATAAVTGKAGPSKIRKCSFSFPKPFAA